MRNTSYLIIECTAGYPIDLNSSLRIETVQDDFTFEGYDLPASGYFDRGFDFAPFYFDNPYTISSTGGVISVVVPQFLYLWYNIIGLRLVWGEESSDGSWHSIDGRKYSAEFQIIALDANTYNQVLLVFLLEVSTEYSPHVQLYIDHLMNGDVVQQITMNTLVPKESFHGNYYYYTDSCTNIAFITFEDTLTISEDQLNNLRSLNIQGSLPAIQPIEDTDIFYRNATATTTTTQRKPKCGIHTPTTTTTTTITTTSTTTITTSTTSTTTITTSTTSTTTTTSVSTTPPNIIILLSFSAAVVFITNVIAIVATFLVPGFLGLDEFGNSITNSNLRRGIFFDTDSFRFDPFLISFSVSLTVIFHIGNLESD